MTNRCFWLIWCIGGTLFSIVVLIIGYKLIIGRPANPMSQQQIEKMLSHLSGGSSTQQDVEKSLQNENVSHSVFADYQGQDIPNAKTVLSARGVPDDSVATVIIAFVPDTYRSINCRVDIYIYFFFDSAGRLIFYSIESQVLSL